MSRDLPPGAPGTESSGLVLVDKPAGWTSHDVVGKVRRLAGTRKVGHAGTLDPMATGLLVVGFNKATRLLTSITGTDKTYLATVRLGQTTTTEDADGEILVERLANAVTEQRVLDAIADLTGHIQQVPSAVSAIKVEGRRAYDRVRSGEDVVLPSRPVTIHRFELTDFRRSEDGRIVDLDVTVECSSGTYIRALARDLGEALDTGAHLTALRRTAVGPFQIADAVTVDQLTERFTATELSAAAAGLFPVRNLSHEEAVELSFGRAIGPTAGRTDWSVAPGEAEAPLVAAQTPEGAVVALIQDGVRAGEPVARPQIVFAPSTGPGSRADTSPEGAR
ncbi:tRNA pseudouridine(55) synthase TruB [Micrococcus terreus]|uniref:tRNA pseudouridine(55) synthase TruB n=1 Tax=Micrococcus terreus TaxID=574650 RepID=UPI003D765A6B